MILLYILIGLCQADQETYIDTIHKVSREYNIDPNLAVSIAVVESNLNPNAIGGLGEIGLFQLRPEYHNVIIGQPRHNIKTAIKYLAELKKICHTKYGTAWFICYNTGPYKKIKVAPKEFSYYKKVMIVYGERLRDTTVNTSREVNGFYCNNQEPY